MHQSGEKTGVKVKLHRFQITMELKTKTAVKVTLLASNGTKTKTVVKVRWNQEYSNKR